MMSTPIKFLPAGNTIHPLPKLDYLRELSGGDHSFVIEILEMFILESPKIVSQSFDFLAENNFEMLRISVHKLKSSVQVVGGVHLTKLISDLEMMAASRENPETLLQSLQSLEHGIAQIVSNLENELQALNPKKGAA